MNLRERVESYKQVSDYQLMSKLPIVIELNGRKFSTLTSLLDKPFDKKFNKCIDSTINKLCNEVEGLSFVYHHNDEFLLILKNDQNISTKPWCQNKIQKIASITASIVSVQFHECALANDLDLLEQPVFYSQVYCVPNITEARNVIIYKQQHNFYAAIQFACFYELLNKYNKEEIKQMLIGLSIDEKIKLLKREVNIDYNLYLKRFRYGVAAYKKNIDDNFFWHIDEDLPFFGKNQELLYEKI